MESKLTEFKQELKQLVLKYDLEVDESENYDVNEEYCGSDYYFIINGCTVYDETISEILRDCIKK